MSPHAPLDLVDDNDATLERAEAVIDRLAAGLAGDGFTDESLALIATLERLMGRTVGLTAVLLRQAEVRGEPPPFPAGAADPLERLDRIGTRLGQLVQQANERVQKLQAEQQAVRAIRQATPADASGERVTVDV